jgi:hypothetical protein
MNFYPYPDELTANYNVHELSRVFMQPLEYKVVRTDHEI